VDPPPRRGRKDGLRLKADDAAAAARAQSEVDPRRVNTLSNLGHLYFEQGRLDEARFLWERVLAVDPDDSEALEGLAKLSSREAAADGGDCGDCYGAAEDGVCCDTCDNVMRAYHKKGWSVSNVFQSALQCSAAANDARVQKEHEATAEPLRKDGMRLKVDDAAAAVRAAVDGCGSCYGAADGVCCDTCIDVMWAYHRKGWSFGDHGELIEGFAQVPPGSVTCRRGGTRALHSFYTVICCYSQSTGTPSSTGCT
jgi:tetratricopeptide (TPR) repeat protein